MARFMTTLKQREMKGMNDLTLVKSANFGDVQCDFYSYGESKEIKVTRRQIGESLEYSDPEDSIKKIHERHRDRLDKFSTRVILSQVEGERVVEREMIIYSARGVYEICRWSQQPKADAFMDFAWDTIEALRTGQYDIHQLKFKSQSEIQNRILSIVENAQPDCTPEELIALTNSLTNVNKVKQNIYGPHRNSNYDPGMHYGFVGNKLARIIPNARLREWRISQRLTQEGMSVRLDISKAKYINIETGYQKPNDDFVDLFAETFGLLKDDALVLLLANKGTLERVR
jgi:DNA-binding XRE family transcriptional regulator/prophage antirepressor-like protein